MNTIHNNGDNDKALDEGLEKLSHAHGKLQHEEPPELLDQAILNSAHRAVEKSPHWTQFGWLHGLTTAAVFVLALSLIFNTREQVPDFEDAMKRNEASGLQRDKTAGKQAPDVQSDDARMELKEENEKRQDALPSAPLSAAPQSGSKKISTGDQAAKPVPADQRSRYAQEKVRAGTAKEARLGHGQQAKTDSADKDVSVNIPVLEEQLRDEAGATAETRETDALSKQSSPTTAAIIAVSENEEPVDSAVKAEQRLLEIINLKESGDGAWARQLELFMEDYPDYPLPEELLN